MLRFYYMSNSGFTDTVIMRGLTKPTLIVARSFMFMILYYIMFQILYICNVIYTVDTTGWQTLGILFAITFAVRCMDVTGLVSYGKAQ